MNTHFKWLPIETYFSYITTKNIFGHSDKSLIRGSFNLSKEFFYLLKNTYCYAN